MNLRRPSEATEGKARGTRALHRFAGRKVIPSLRLRDERPGPGSIPLLRALTELHSVRCLPIPNEIRTMMKPAENNRAGEQRRRLSPQRRRTLIDRRPRQSSANGCYQAATLPGDPPPSAGIRPPWGPYDHYGSKEDSVPEPPERAQQSPARGNDPTSLRPPTCGVACDSRSTTSTAESNPTRSYGARCSTTPPRSEDRCGASGASGKGEPGDDGSAPGRLEEKRGSSAGRCHGGENARRAGQGSSQRPRALVVGASRDRAKHGGGGGDVTALGRSLQRVDEKV